MNSGCIPVLDPQKTQILLRGDCSRYLDEDCLDGLEDILTPNQSLGTGTGVPTTNWATFRQLS